MKMQAKTLTAAAACLILGVSLASAQSAGRAGRVAGLSVTPTTVAGTNVDFDIDLATQSDTGTTPANNPYGIGFIGNHYQLGFYLSSFATYQNIFVDIIDPEINAIAYNAGATGSATQAPVQTDTLPLLATGTPNRFRGSFSTTYPGAGSYLLQAGAVQRVDLTPLTQSTGTPETIPAYSPLSALVQITYTGYPGSNTTFTATALTFDAQIAVRNQVSLTLTGAGGGGPNPLEIPTLGQLGAALLALALGAAAIVLLRR